MDYSELLNILENLQQLNPRKASKLLKLLDRYNKEKDVKKKRIINSRINNFIFHVFLDCIDKEIGKELYNLSICISEDIYGIQEKEKSWIINSKGASQYKVVDGEFTEIGNIERNYRKGFKLKEDATDDEINFYKRNHNMLFYIAFQMDKKEEIVTNYQVKDPNISREFTESLLDYLNFSRIENDNNKKLGI